MAATIYRFIREANRPQEGLKTILQSRKIGHLSDLGRVYIVVLRTITASAKDKPSEEKLYREFRTIVGIIIRLAKPLLRIILATLLDISTDDI